MNSNMEEKFQSDYCITYFRPEMEAVFIQWKKFCYGKDYRDPLIYSLELMNKYHGLNMVCDARNGFEDEEEDVRWDFEVYIPELAKSGCKNIVFIVNSENHIEGEIDMFTKEFMKYFNVYKCTSIEEAKRIVTEN